eukprot:Mrub_01399.p1 GENE.Mrub_01399~~Mrub_01399.p1  ORF type:complete len:718 (+),score=181.69 Mrub_01399:218-2155(+)
MYQKIKRFYDEIIKEVTRSIYVSESHNPFPLDLELDKKIVWLPFPLDNTKLNRFYDELYKMNKFYPQDLVNQLVQLYNLLVNLNHLVPLYRELDDKSTLEQLEYNEQMIIEYYLKIIKNATTLTLYKIDEFFATVVEAKDKELKHIYTFANDTNVSYGVYLMWEKDRGQKVKFDENFNVSYEPYRYIWEKKNNIYRSIYMRYDYKARNKDPDFIVVNGVIEWDLFRCPNMMKIFPNCKLKEQITEFDVDDKRRDISKKEFTAQVQLHTDLFIQHVDNNDDEEEQREGESKSKYELEVVWWDEESKTYHNKEIGYRKRTKEAIWFKTSVNAPHAIAVKRNIDFPFKNFFIRNAGDAIYIDLETKRIDLKFMIKVVKGKSQIKLLNNIDDLLNGIHDKWFYPVQLLMKLQNIGINLLPLENDASRNNCFKKDDDVSNFAYDVVSMLSIACSFKSTQFCQTEECGSDKIILKVRDNEDNMIYYDEDERRDWSYVCIYRNMLGIIETNYLDTKLNLNLKQGCKNHYNLKKFVHSMLITSKASSDLSETSQLEDEANKLSERIDNLSEEIYDQKNKVWESTGDDDQMKNIICLRNTLKAMRIFEMTLTDDKYIAPEFEYEDYKHPEEQLDEENDEENQENVEGEGTNEDN